MPHYVIHIGPHKTATTYLQRVFRSQRAYMARRGIVYPDHWITEDSPGHAELAPALDAGCDLRCHFDALNATTGTVLLSTESFAYLETSSISALRDLLGTHPATIVFYARHWADVIVSDWRSRIKRGQFVRPLADAFNHQMSTPYASHMVNHRVQLDPWAEVFGQENIRIGCFNMLDTDILEHFTRTFLPGVQLSPAAHWNVSPDAIEAETLRAVNSVRHTAKRPLVGIGRFRDARLDFARTHAAMRADMGPLSIVPGSRLFQEINADTAAAYEMVQPHLDGLLYPVERDPPQAVLGEYLLAPGVVREIRQAALSFDRI